MILYLRSSHLIQGGPLEQQKTDFNHNLYKTTIKISITLSRDLKLFITLYIHFDLCRLLALFVPGDQRLLKHLLEVPVLQVYLEVPGVQIVLSPPLVLVFRNSRVILVARTVPAVQEDHVLLLNLPDLGVLEDQVLLELRDGPIKMNNIRRTVNRNNFTK